MALYIAAWFNVLTADVDLRGDIGAIIDKSWLPLPEDPDHHPPKNEPFSQDMHLKILL